MINISEQMDNDVYVVVGRPGTWWRGPWEKDYSRHKQELVRCIRANNLRAAKETAKDSGYDPSQRQE